MTNKYSIKTSISNHYKRFKESLSTPLQRRLFFNRIMKFIVNILKYILIIGLCFVILYPILLQLAIAFRAPEDVNNPAILWIPEQFSIKNFEVAMLALKYWEALRYTFILSFFITLLQLVSTTLAGYAFARLKFRGSTILFAFALFTIIVPQTVISLPLLRSITKMGLIDKPMTLFLMSGLGMGIRSGIFIYLFRQFYRGIPLELEEAAIVDGASAFQVFHKIMLPNAKPALITVGLLSFVWQWNDFYFTKLFSGGKYFTLTTQQVAIEYGLQGALVEAKVWGLLGQDITGNPYFVSMILNTSGILIMLPLLIIYFFVQKMFVEGIERSGIVG